MEATQNPRLNVELYQNIHSNKLRKCSHIPFYEMSLPCLSLEPLYLIHSIELVFVFLKTIDDIIN